MYSTSFFFLALGLIAAAHAQMVGEVEEISLSPEDLDNLEDVQVIINIVDPEDIPLTDERLIITDDGIDVEASKEYGNWVIRQLRPFISADLIKQIIKEENFDVCGKA